MQRVACGSKPCSVISTHTVKKTSVSLHPDVLENGRLAAENNGQSLSSYINTLIRRDLGLSRDLKRKAAGSKKS